MTTESKPNAHYKQELSDTTLELGDVYEGTLNRREVDALVGEILRSAVVQEIRCKASPRSHGAQPKEIDLRAAVRALDHGQVRAVQVRYRTGGEDWSDTIFSADGSFRVVRTKMPPFR